uniref:Uncharacterized protein n=1 Tax=Anguilla anguilla TaxID=7936 RepID=A0A0E9TD44_ANGAN
MKNNPEQAEGSTTPASHPHVATFP